MDWITQAALLPGLLIGQLLLPGLLIGQLCLTVLCMDPEFDMPVVNVTVKETSTAILPCAVKYLGNHEVVWTDQFSTLLTYQDRRIIDDERLSVERPFTKDWNLHIRSVRHSDQGVYNCQINTVPVKVKIINLRVEVPAKIVQHLSTQDVTVPENEQVTLVCNVSGVPAPEVTWYRHVADGIQGKERQKVGVSGEVLVIHNVTRYCGDTYECVAFNGVPPAAVHLVRVEVMYAPEIILPNKRIGQDMGKETILECSVSSFPQSSIVWKRHGKTMESVPLKYRVEMFEEGKDTHTLSLRIYSIERNDFGTYTCEAFNSQGQDAESMILYEYSAYVRTMTTTTTSKPTSTTSSLPAAGGRPTQAVHSPPSEKSDLPNAILPPVVGRGQNGRPSNTYMSSGDRDPWDSPLAPRGSNGAVLPSNMGGSADRVTFPWTLPGILLVVWCGSVAAMLSAPGYL